MSWPAILEGAVLDRGGEDALDVLHNEEARASFAHDTEERLEHLAPGVTDGPALAGGAERLTARAAGHHDRFVPRQAGLFEDFFGGDIFELPGNEGKVGPVAADGVGGEPVALQGDADLEASILKANVEAETAGEER